MQGGFRLRRDSTSRGSRRGFSHTGEERRRTEQRLAEISGCLYTANGVPCELSRLAASLRIPDSTVARGAAICCAIIKGRLFRRQSLLLTAASSIYVACRETKTPVTIRELAAISHSDPSELGRCYRLITDRLRLAVPSLNGTTYVSKVASRVRASAEASALSAQIVKRAVEGGLGDRNPMTLAAAAVYTASLSLGEIITQSDVAAAAEVSVVSVRDCARRIRPLLIGMADVSPIWAG